MFGFSISRYHLMIGSLDGPNYTIKKCSWTTIASICLFHHYTSKLVCSIFYRCQKITNKKPAAMWDLSVCKGTSCSGANLMGSLELHVPLCTSVGELASTSWSSRPIRLELYYLFLFLVRWSHPATSLSSFTHGYRGD